MNNSYTDDRIANPFHYYETPAHVLRDDVLDHEDKRKVLESMKVDAQLLSTATAENMGGGNRPHLKDVEDALLALVGPKEA